MKSIYIRIPEKNHYSKQILDTSDHIYTINKIVAMYKIYWDENKYQKYTVRKKQSTWSEKNKLEGFDPSKNHSARSEENYLLHHRRFDVPRCNSITSYVVLCPLTGQIFC